MPAVNRDNPEKKNCELNSSLKSQDGEVENEHFKDEDNKITGSRKVTFGRSSGLFAAEDLSIIEASTQGTESSETNKDRCHSGSSQFNGYDSGSWELLDNSDISEIPIAGFNKQNLLEMCNFCKISYGNNDDRLASKYQTRAELIKNGYAIIPFYYTNNNKTAGFVFVKDSEITIAYRGTQNLDDIIIDTRIAFTSGFLTEGAKIHSGFYNAFEDSRISLKKALTDCMTKQRSEVKDFKFNCTGHSMGGALANIAALYLKKTMCRTCLRCNFWFSKSF